MVSDGGAGDKCVPLPSPLDPPPLIPFLAEGDKCWRAEGAIPWRLFCISYVFSCSSSFLPSTHMEPPTLCQGNRMRATSPACNTVCVKAAGGAGLRFALA
eukprot:Hpha_TRINITY_DN16801_c4_g5::TRINITY_DN16801_c4_g5_i2::g.149595::m.149595